MPQFRKSFVRNESGAWRTHTLCDKHFLTRQIHCIFSIEIVTWSQWKRANWCFTARKMSSKFIKKQVPIQILVNMCLRRTTKNTYIFSINTVLVSQINCHLFTTIVLLLLFAVSWHFRGRQPDHSIITRTEIMFKQPIVLAALITFCMSPTSACFCPPQFPSSSSRFVCAKLLNATKVDNGLTYFTFRVKRDCEGWGSYYFTAMTSVHPICGPFLFPKLTYIIPLSPFSRVQFLSSCSVGSGSQCTLVLLFLLSFVGTTSAFRSFLKHCQYSAVIETFFFPSWHSMFHYVLFWNCQKIRRTSNCSSAFSHLSCRNQLRWPSRRGL